MQYANWNDNRSFYEFQCTNTEKVLDEEIDITVVARQTLTN